MTVCPKCNRKLRITDIDQCCPDCKVNLRFYNYEETFMREAKQAELSFAKLHVKTKRLKASFLGNKLTIARLCVMLLPLLTLLIPTATYTMKLPFLSDGEASLVLSALGLFNAYSSGALNYVFAMTGSSVSGVAFTAIRNSLTVLAVCAVLAILCFLLSLLGFISIKNMQKIICGVSAAGIIVSVTAYFTATSVISQLGNTVSGKSGFGALITAAAFAAVFTVNLLLCIKGIPVEYDEGDLERVEIAKKIHAGEIDFDALPQPIVQTAATRAIEEEILKEQESFEKKHANSEEA